MTYCFVLKIVPCSRLLHVALRAAVGHSYNARSREHFLNSLLIQHSHLGLGFAFSTFQPTAYLDVSFT